jgi:uncharacterized membrane protein YphA (DoxX/SURF4 family)
MTTHSTIDQNWQVLRLTYGLVAFLAGLDKFFHLLTNWDQYLAPQVAALLPVSGPVFMRAVGVIEMLVGVLVLTAWTRIGAYIAAAWLVSIAINLAMTGAYFDVAVRDVAMAVGAWTLARLSEARQPHSSTGLAPAAAPSARAEA